MTAKMHNDRVIFIAAISSDIGRRLALLYRNCGCSVVGTHRLGTDVSFFDRQDGISLIECDVADNSGIKLAAARFGETGVRWTTFISAVGDLTPIGRFFDVDSDHWARSVHANAVGQLQLLHALHPYRAVSKLNQVAFLVGGGINGPFPNYSAYCLGKVTLVKMVELLDDEYEDIHAVAVGTGWVNTKIHRQTLAAGARAGSNLDRTQSFLASSAKETSVEDVFDCVEWCFAQKREWTGGRNFSVVHDGWRQDEPLTMRLKDDRNMYKLRRFGN